METTDNLNIMQFKPLITPEGLKKIYPETEHLAETVAHSRQIIGNILAGRDSRKLVIAGPCSMHDEKAAVEYAAKLKDLQIKISDKVFIVMRTYFEKPRTTLGWKGMIYDPHLDGSYDIEEGFKISRRILTKVGNFGLACATEFLDPIVPQYLSDLISWAAVGARTTESQIHRQMASGLSMPIGFKNSTDGNLTPAIDAINAASSSHSFMGINENGCVVIAETRGNRFGHLVMRGGANNINYSEEYVAFAEILLKKANINNGIIIDCSHANSEKDFAKQKNAVDDVAAQLEKGADVIKGIMLESFLIEGSQRPAIPSKLTYGQSVTDSCIGWQETEELINYFAEKVKS